MSENIHWGQGSSSWQPSRHWLHRGLSFWHRPVRPGREGFVAVVTLWSQVTGFSVHFVFPVYYEYYWDDWNIIENCVKMLSWSHVFVVLRNKEFLIPDVVGYVFINICVRVQINLSLKYHTDHKSWLQYFSSSWFDKVFARKENKQRGFRYFHNPPGYHVLQEAPQERKPLPRLCCGMWNSLDKHEKVYPKCFRLFLVLSRAYPENFHENSFGYFSVMLTTDKQTHDQIWKHNLRHLAAVKIFRSKC